MTEPSNGSAPAGAGANAVEAAISLRARAAMKSARDAGLARSADSAAHAGSTRSAGSARTGPAQGLLDGLRHHLLAGETHYPDRPGMGELRRRVGAALPAAGFPAREPDGVLITAGEGESLFATLLGLGGGEGTSIAGKTGGRHQRLLDWMRVRVTEPGAEADPEAAFRLIEYEEGASVPEDGNAAHDPGLPQVHAIGSRLFAETDARARSASAAPIGVSSSAEGPGAGASAPTDTAGALADAIVIGSLDGLEGMEPFSLGFVATSSAMRPRIAKWKQASSICSPAPSQRAALWALGVRP